ncbi:MAG TPA: helix-turn-helix domain-containing protein [Parachlamydiaceae bacterium]|nr:helix-turn-helix domain-containing protein [Parachlamydiaceae bacterium]
MKKAKRSEKLLLDNIFNSGKDLLKQQRDQKIGPLIALIRNQLRMPQEVIAKRSGVPQSTISRIESGRLNPNITTLEKIMSALECDLIISAVPKEDLETTRKKQAYKKARKKISYLHGTMSLEKQAPTLKILNELIDEEVKDLLNSTSSQLWEDQ